jgi:hypothetical protein
MFCGIFEDKLFVRLAEGERAKLLALEGASLFEPMRGRPMREYVVLPAEMLEDTGAVRTWMGTALAFGAGLPAKGTGKGKPAGKPKARRRPAPPRPGGRKRPSGRNRSWVRSSSWYRRVRVEGRVRMKRLVSAVGLAVAVWCAAPTEAAPRPPATSPSSMARATTSTTRIRSSRLAQDAYWSSDGTPYNSFIYYAARQWSPSGCVVWRTGYDGNQQWWSYRAAGRVAASLHDFIDLYGIPTGSW